MLSQTYNSYITATSIINTFDPNSFDRIFEIFITFLRMFEYPSFGDIYNKDKIKTTTIIYNSQRTQNI